MVHVPRAEGILTATPILRQAQDDRVAALDEMVAALDEMVAAQDEMVDARDDIARRVA